MYGQTEPKQVKELHWDENYDNEHLGKYENMKVHKKIILRICSQSR